MKKETSKRLTREQLAELKSLAALPDNAIDTSDAPELLDWTGAKRRVFYRPVKQQLTLRLDADVVAWFKSHTKPSEGYQHASTGRCASTCKGRQAGVGGLGLEITQGRGLHIGDTARIRRCLRGPRRRNRTVYGGISPHPALPSSPAAAPR
jgi:uncharacterized protein (DUF4415 family)